jgi:transposase
MSKSTHFLQKKGSIAAMVFCGIDVSAKTLAVTILSGNRPSEHREFDNTISGHKALIAWLHKKGPARVSMEATGIYSLDVALALDRAPGIEVAVLNPKKVHDFAKHLNRSKTDKADAQALAEYSLRMQFVPWRAPSQGALQLRAICRHLHNLVIERTRQNNRLHAATSTIDTPRCVLQDMKRALARIGHRIDKLRREAAALVACDQNTSKQFKLLISIPGIASISALQLLGEVALLAPDMNVRQWVAHSGLDPAHHQSGTSVRKPSRISRAGNKHLRKALYMPAMVAARHDPHFRAFYQKLLDRRKAKLQAIIAVARKLLHAVYAILKTNTPYEGTKLFPQLCLE